MHLLAAALANAVFPVPDDPYFFAKLRSGTNKKNETYTSRSQSYSVYIFLFIILPFFNEISEIFEGLFSSKISSFDIVWNHSRHLSRLPEFFSFFGLQNFFLGMFFEQTFKEFSSFGQRKSPKNWLKKKKKFRNHSL